MKKPEAGEIQQILADYQPERTPISESLEPWRELIEGLQRRRASLRVIVQILKNRGVQCSESSLLRYLRDTGIQPRKISARRAKPRRRRGQASPDAQDTDNASAQTDQWGQDSRVIAEQPPSNAHDANAESPGNRAAQAENPPPLPPISAGSTGGRVRKRGPRIAQIKLLEDSET